MDFTYLESKYSDIPLKTFLAYTHFTEKLRADQFQFLLRILPEAIQEKVLRYRRWEDAHASLFGKLLLLYTARQAGKTNFLLEHLQYTEFNRPFIEGSIDFNISHSKNLVACVFDESNTLGLDVEQKRAVPFEDFLNVYTSREWEEIRKAEDQQGAFFYFWTRKEALIKADGRGMSLILTDIEVLPESIDIGEYSYSLKQLFIKEGYLAHLAILDDSHPLIMTECSPEFLIQYFSS